MSEHINFVITSAFTGVLSTFKTAVDAFNAQNGKLLSGTLDQNVILYRKRDGAVIAQGNVKVLAALEKLFVPVGTGTTPAIFIPLTIHPHPVTHPVIVRGEAAWHDNDGSPDDTIRYEFTFDPANSLISTLWAQHK